MALPAAVVAVTLIFAGVLMCYRARPTRIAPLDEGVRDHGMYGDVYTWESVRTARLTGELSTIEMRTNGASLGSRRKGHFRTGEYGAAKLFAGTRHPPFIHLETNQGL